MLNDTGTFLELAMISISAPTTSRGHRMMMISTYPIWEFLLIKVDVGQTLLYFDIVAMATVVMCIL